MQLDKNVELKVKQTLGESLKTIFKDNVRQYTMLIALVVIIVLFQILTKGILLVPMNVTNLILQNSYVFILSIGMTLCIVSSGNIDLSVGSIVAFIGALAGILIINNKMALFPAILICLAVGLLIGIWQGFWIAYIRIPAFIVTLSGMLLFRGLTVKMLQGLTLSPFPKSFQAISGGFFPDIFKNSNINITTIIVGILVSIIYVYIEFKNRAEREKYNFDVLPLPLCIAKIILIVSATMLVTYWLAVYKGIPIMFAIIGILVFLYTIITSKTIPGRYLYAMGGNEKSAKLSGINTNKVLFLVYVNMAVLSAIAAISFTSRLNAASPQSGLNFELDAIAACYIGGASAYGGIGTVIGAIVGALVMGVLNNGMSILGVGSDMQMAIKGLVLLLAVAFDVFSKRKAKI
ncbi:MULTISPECIES: multiple monosaccharide ABC transporter permease [Clostridium]|uniref:multiple monosaccharide ABC transporter permease n=1 Tax=Clostridium TaxID=1485 RepID=UPI001896FD12|nr:MULTISPECIES: multiple monosaccharide ABC transporter permease [Clostridium]MCR1952366.1 sugar ABC transporter permease [Clostridium sp. DSM 100503]MDI9218491.1 sugar ABC transporter permease [Clostridium tertium]